MIKMTNSFWLIIFLLVVACMAAPPAGQKFSWVAKSWPRPAGTPPGFPMKVKAANRGDSLTISCETNDPEVTVVLNYHTRNRPPKQFQNYLVKNKGGVVEKNQKFVIYSLKMSDRGFYTCTAVDKNGANLPELHKGQLLVNNVQNTKPEILPKDDPIEVETNGKQKVRCQTIGRSGKDAETVLKWYKIKGGKRVEIVDSVDLRVTSEKKKRNDDRFIDVESLTFTSFKASHEGKYVCVRSESGRTTERAMNMRKAPDVKPSVTIGAITPTPKPPENSQLSLTCTATGSPKPSMWWLVNGIIMKNCSRSTFKLENSSCPWIIPKVKLEQHNGVFTCEAQNLAGTDEKKINIEVQVAPEMDSRSAGVGKTSLVARSNEAVEFFALVKRANPLPLFSWDESKCAGGGGAACTKANSAWKPVAEQGPRGKKTERSYMVTAETDSIYFYRFTASNPSGNKTYSFKVTRRRDDTEQFGIVTTQFTKPGVIEVYEGDLLQFECLVNTQVYKTQTILKGGKGQVFTKETRGDTLALKFSLKKAVTTSGGVYTCQAVSGSDVTRTRTVDVKVLKLLPPSITGFVDKKIVQTDQPLVISCNAAGSPPPTVSWKFNRSQTIMETLKTPAQCKFSEGMYKLEDGRKMVVCKLDFLKHAGEYECTAKNKVSSTSASMTLSVEAKPMLVKWHPELTLDLDKKGELACSASANPIANVTWYFRKKGTDVFITSGLGTSVVRIRKVSKKDKGDYLCRAFNKHGKVEGKLKLTLAGFEAVYQSDKKVIIGIVVAAIILVLLGILLMCWYKRKLKEKYALYLAPDDTFEIDPDKSLFEQSNDLPYNMAWEFPRERLTFLKTLGSGAFGEVWLAEAAGIHNFKPRDTSAAAVKKRKSMQKSKRYTSVIVKYKKQQDLGQIDLEKTKVAVKKLKEGASTEEYKDLASELKIIIHLGEHKNIVNLLGACTIGGDLNVILECCPHGNLLKFLRDRREMFRPEWYKKETDMEKELTYIDLVMICHQAARGMEFLQAKKCVHRDLAARNVLVGTDYIMKIGDFGLARDISNDDLYLKQTSGLLPVKWMAVESLFDKIFTSMSDVWSFGILLWEVFTLGGSPYPGLPTEDLFTFLDEGKRMERPDTCPVEMYEIMMDCWEKSPYARPMFGAIEERIGNCMKQNAHNDADTYLDYRDAAPPQDDYLMANDDSRKAAPPGDYLMANDMSNGTCGEDPLYQPPEDKFSKFSPPGTTYVPPVAGSISDDEQHYDPVDLGDEPLIPKANRKPSYEDMAPAVEFGGNNMDDDYLDPTESTYLNPVDMHPTTV